MANNLNKNLTRTASERFIEGFANNMVALRYCDRQILEGQFNKKSGDTITMKVPTQYKSVDLTARANGEMTSADLQDIETGTIAAKVNFFQGVPVQINMIEEALKADNLDELLSPITRRLVQDMESRIFAEAALGAAAVVGGVSTMDAMASWLDMREVKAYFTKIGYSTDRANAFLNPDVFTSISQDVKTSFNPELVRETIREYYGGRLAGIDTYETMSSLTFGSTAVPANAAVAGPHDNLFTNLADVKVGSLTLKAAATVKRGMKFTIAGVKAINQETKEVIKEKGADKLQVFTVLADSTGTTVSYSPALIATGAQQNVSAAAADSAVVTWLNTAGKNPSIIWTPDAVAVAFVPLQPVSTAEGYTSSQDGVSIRTQRQGSVMGNTDTMRFDVMAAIKVIDPIKVVLGFKQ